MKTSFFLKKNRLFNYVIYDKKIKKNKKNRLYNYFIDNNNNKSLLVKEKRYSFV